MDVLSAKAAAVQDEGGTLLVAFADTPDGDGEVLELMRGHSFDEQQRGLGLDTYSIGTIAGTHHGGVVSWSLQDRVLELQLDDKAQGEFGTDGFRVDLHEIDEAKLPAIADGLRRVFVEVPEASAEQSADNITPPAPPVRRSA